MSREYAAYKMLYNHKIVHPFELKIIRLNCNIKTGKTFEMANNFPERFFVIKIIIRLMFFIRNFWICMKFAWNHTEFTLTFTVLDRLFCMQYVWMRDIDKYWDWDWKYPHYFERFSNLLRFIGMQMFQCMPILPLWYAIHIFWWIHSNFNIFSFKSWPYHT